MAPVGPEAGDDDPAVVGAERIRGLDGPGRHDAWPGRCSTPTATRASPRSNARELTGLGPVQDLRLSRDGLRVAAVVRGGLYTAALARSPDGDVAVRNVRSLRPSDLGEVVAVDWRAAETIVAVSRRMDGPVSQVSVDGLTWDLLPGSNLTPPLRRSPRRRTVPCW